MKSSLVRLLLSDNGFVSGEEISRRLSVSRSAVWKAIQCLKADGAKIEASPHNGYRLLSLPDVLKPEYLGAYLKDAPEIRWFKEIVSTNTYLKGVASSETASGIVAVAENQTGGRGRLERSWESRPGDAIQMSFLIRPDITPTEAPRYNFAAALGICAAIERQTGVKALIKWPNDVVYENKKLCGILTEMSSELDRVEFIVAGCGTNVNNEYFAGELADRAVSLKMITGARVDRLKLCAAQIEEIVKYFNMAKSDMGKLIREYNRKSAVLGKNVRLICGNSEFSGKCEGFGDMGELLLKTDEGTLPIYAGEVSLRGTYGYV